jgi:WhiB family redox-sensing transcriptional regulator
VITQLQISVLFPSALCGQVAPDMWFPDKGGSSKPAKDICHKCPHESECLEEALGRDERFGIYGGKSERERRVIVRDRKKALLAA